MTGMGQSNLLTSKLVCINPILWFKVVFVKPDVFKTSKILREINTFEREDGTPLHYTLINIKDWCKNTFEGVNQLRQSRSQTIRILP
jgi:hypothetical protein